jgi:hypothetical protein
VDQPDVCDSHELRTEFTWRQAGDPGSPNALLSGAESFDDVEVPAVGSDVEVVSNVAPYCEATRHCIIQRIRGEIAAIGDDGDIGTAGADCIIAVHETDCALSCVVAKAALTLDEICDSFQGFECVHRRTESGSDEEQRGDHLSAGYAIVLRIVGT